MKHASDSLLVPCILLLLLLGSLSLHPGSIVASATALPASFSWRDINGTDYTTPIKDQSPSPTCEAYALCAALETKVRYALHAQTTPDLSEAHLYFYAGGTIAKGYVNLADAANYLMTYGVPDEGCFPDPHRPADFPYRSLDGWENRTTKITDWGWVTHDNESIKQALIAHGPLAVCIHFPMDFFYYHSGVYTPTWGQNAGGHVVALVGYNDSQACWILKNSWGTRWGENGWFRLSYTADIFSTWYGPDSGIMYLGNVTGNLNPHVPIVQFTTPLNYYTYFSGLSLPTILKKITPERGAARFIGPASIQATASNATSVSFYVDGVLMATDTEPPYTWQLSATRGLHTLDAVASDGTNLSKDTIDFWTATTVR